jgi:DNA-binding XRE family transcriptional regulator
MEPEADAAANERRTEPTAPRHGGRRYVDDPDLTDIVEAIKLQLSADFHNAREGRGFSQAELAEAAGVAAKTVLDIEKCRLDPHLSTVARIAYALGYEPFIVFRKPRCPRRPPYLASVNSSASAISS